MTDAKEGKLHEAFDVARDNLQEINRQLDELSSAQVKAMDSDNRSLVDSLSVQIVELGPKLADAIEAKAAARLADEIEAKAAAYKAWRG